jgi:hypothetical protein
MPRCDYCTEPADFRRPPTAALKNEGFRCNTHTPEWRIHEFDALTLVATQRKAKKDVDDLPRPKSPEFDKAGATERVAKKRKARVAEANADALDGIK